jgi:MFS family permease
MHDDFVRNTAGISAVEFLWGLGTPVVIESTFLQLFLRNLGASSLLVGLIPSLFAGGLALIAPLSGVLTARLVRKKPAVVGTHVAASLPLLALGIYLWTAGFTPSSLGVFFSTYALFSLGVGMLWPVWQNYLVRIFSPQAAVPALAVMTSSASVAKIISSFMILKMVERYSFSPRGSALIFSLVGVVFLAGSFLFLATREPGPPEADNSREVPTHPSRPRGRRLLQAFFAEFREGAREVTGNLNFLRFLGTELEYFGLVGIVAFYANYATEFCGVSAAAASGLFVALNYLGGITANALLGWLGLLSLRNKFLVTKLMSLAAVPLLCFSCSLASFLVASFFFGASRGTRMAAFAPAVKHLSGRDDSTHYFALAPLLLLPLSTGIPLAAGALIDRFGELGSWSYRSVFLGMGALIAIGVLFLLTVSFDVDRPARPGEVRRVGSGAISRTRRS